MGCVPLRSKEGDEESGHFYFAGKRTFLFSVDTVKVGAGGIAINTGKLGSKNRLQSLTLKS
jgi:hypothetical protein